MGLNGFGEVGMLGNTGFAIEGFYRSVELTWP
jgi:hypothetical protein